MRGGIADEAIQDAGLLHDLDCFATLAMTMTLNPAIFREYDIRGKVPTTLDEAAAYAIGRAFGARIGKKGQVCVGYDGRLSSPSLRDALAKGLMEEGHEVVDTGLGPTPQLYFAVCSLAADAGVMVTGSHNPPDENGFKFMLGGKPFFGADIQQLRQATEREFPPARQGTTRSEEVADDYVKKLVEAFRAKRKVKVAWDAGNGAAGEAMKALTSALPGEHILLNEKIDGNFPAHHPDPSDPKNLQQLIEVVRGQQCDIGIAFDGDGDRIGVVDNEGGVLWGDQLLMLFAEDVLKETPGALIIADVKASNLLFERVRALGGRPLMWKTGHSHIKAKMQETGAALAGEMSGHMFFADRYYGYDDALYAAVRAISSVAVREETLADWRRSLPQSVSTPEFRFPCADDRKFNVIEEVRARLKAAGADFSDVDGARVNTKAGWWLLRASNTQAVLSARAEARDEPSLQALLGELKAQLEKSGLTLHG